MRNEVRNEVGDMKCHSFFRDRYVTSLSMFVLFVASTFRILYLHHMVDPCLFPRRTFPTRLRRSHPHTRSRPTQ